MTRKNEDKLKKAILKICRLDVEENFLEEKLKNEHCDIISELGFDSLLIVELIAELEEVFSIEFDMNRLDINTLKFYDELKASVDNYIGE